MPSVCEHLVSLIQGLSSNLLEAEVASSHHCAVLRAGGLLLGCMCACMLGV